MAVKHRFCREILLEFTEQSHEQKVSQALSDTSEFLSKISRYLREFSLIPEMNAPGLKLHSNNMFYGSCVWDQKFLFRNSKNETQNSPISKDVGCNLVELRNTRVQLVFSSSTQLKIHTSISSQI